MKRIRVLAALGVVGVALIYLIATAVSDTKLYYLTVAEAVARGEALEGQPVRMMGAVDGASIDWDPASMVLRFVVVEGDLRVPALYQGPKPDNFVGGAQAILEGRLGEDGVFRVNKLMMTCPSRYEAAPGVETAHPEYQ